MNRIKEVRERRGMSQKDLAEKVGLTAPNMSRLEKSKTQLTEDMATRLGPILGVQPGDLLPLITDGSVPLKTDLSQHQISVLYESLAFFMEMHTGRDRPESERLAMAAIKLFQMALGGVKDHPFFHMDQVKDSLARGQSSGEE